MARSRGGSSHRGRAQGASRGSSRAQSRPPSLSSQQTPFRRPKRPASEWHSDGSQPRLPISSRNASRHSSQSSTRPGYPQSTGQDLFLAPNPGPRPSPAPRNAQNEIDESIDHVVMALDIRERGVVGCAYYVASEERLFCMEDVPTDGLETAEKCEMFPAFE